MSQHLTHIPALLNANQVTEVLQLIQASNFVDGKLTASMAAKTAKNNMQLDTNDTHIKSIHTIINAAVNANPLFNIAALPKTIYPYIISKYGVGKYYGWHVDSPIMGQPPVRTDVAMTIFLSDPSTYEGGELIIQSGGQTVALKPAQGDAVLYPCQYLHCVNEIKSGERIAAVTWIQSNVKDPGQRQLLFELNQVHGALYQQAPNAAETNLLLQVHSNLFRMWADV